MFVKFFVSWRNRCMKILPSFTTNYSFFTFKINIGSINIDWIKLSKNLLSFVLRSNPQRRPHPFDIFMFFLSSTQCTHCHKFQSRQCALALQRKFSFGTLIRNRISVDDALMRFIKTAKFSRYQMEGLEATNKEMKFSFIGQVTSKLPILSQDHSVNHCTTNCSRIFDIIPTCLL